MASKSLQGQLLVASPKLADPNFARSVILMVQHGDEGALGLILNRPLDTAVKAVWAQVSETPCDYDGLLHQGGPCEGPLMLVHGDQNLSQIEVLDGVHFSTDKESIQELVARNDSPMKFFVGYAGWAPGQLEGELEEGAWLTAPATTHHVFEGVGGEQWNALVKQISLATTYPWLDPKLIPPDPSYN